MKKTLLIIGIIMTVIMAGITTVNAVTASAELKTSSATVKPGDTFNVILSLTTDKAVESIGGDQLGVSENDFFAIIYDESKLELTNQETVATGIMDSGIDIDEETGESYGRATNNVELWGTTISSGDLYKWTFKVKSNAEPEDIEIKTSKLIITDFSDEETEVQTQPVTIKIVNDSSNSEGQNNNDNEGNSGGQNNNNNGGNSEGQNNNDNEGNSGGQNNNNNGANSGKQNNGNKGNGTTGKLNENSSTSGKTPDLTTAASAGKIIPSAGSAVIKSMLIVGIVATGIVAYKKAKQLKDVK